MSEQDFENFEEKVQSVSQKLHLDIDWARSISESDVDYLLDHCPFLQMVNSEPDLNQNVDVQIVTAESSNWDIHHHGEAMSSSPGRFLYAGGYFKVRFGGDDDDDEGGGIVNPRQGTVINQAFNTAVEMVDLAKQQGWAGVHLVDGHRVMMRAAWIGGLRAGLEISGFEPEHIDYFRRDRIERTPENFEVLKTQLRAGR